MDACTRNRIVTAIGLGILVVATSGVMPAVAAKPEPKAATRAETAPILSFDVVAGRWNFTGRNVTLKDAAREISAKAPVEIRIQDATLETIKLGIAFQGADAKEGMASLLQPFNYSEFDDPKTGRRVYLVMSLARDVKPTLGARTAVAAAAPKATTSANELRTAEPARIKSREQSQAEIEAYKREQEEKLVRALDALKNKEENSLAHLQALPEISASTDPRATAALKDVWAEVQGVPIAAPQVARSAWQHAALLQFADADANALLLSMTSSMIPGVREVAEAARLDMERVRAAQKPR